MKALWLDDFFQSIGWVGFGGVHHPLNL